MRKHVMRLNSFIIMIFMLSWMTLGTALGQALKGLPEGKYTVGVKKVVVVDYSRSTANQLNYKQQANPIAAPFTLNLQVWYPAKSKAQSYLSYGDLVLMNQGDFKSLSASEKKKRLREIMLLDSLEVELIYKWKSNSRADAQPEKNTFPLIISYSTSPGFNEFVASHGYVVACIQSAISDRAATLNERQWEFNEVIENISLTRNSISQNFPGITISKTALAGFSYYGAMMQLAQMRSAAYDAVVSMDGTEAWTSHAVNLQGSQYLKPEAARAPVLRLHNEEQPGLDWSMFYDKAVYCDRWILSMDGIDHGFIVSSYLDLNLSALKNEKVPDDRKRKHEQMWSCVVRFLNYYLLNDLSGKEWLQTQLKQPAVDTLKFIPALNIQPPSNAELKQLIERDGITGVRNLYVSLDEHAALLSVPVLFNLSYEYRFSNTPLAIDIMKLATELHPQSSLACFRLALYYSQRRNWQEAIMAAEIGIQKHQASTTSDLSKAQAEQLQRLIESWKKN